MSEANRLDVLDEALIALAVCLDDHGPACVCVPCTALAASQGLLVRLAHVLAILQAWEREEAEEPILPQDIGMLLTMLDEDSTVRHAAGRAADTEPRDAGAGEA